MGGWVPGRDKAKLGREQWLAVAVVVEDSGGHVQVCSLGILYNAGVWASSELFTQIVDIVPNRWFFNPLSILLPSPLVVPSVYYILFFFFWDGVSVLLRRLECNGSISAHRNLRLLGSGNSPASVSLGLFHSFSRSFSWRQLRFHRLTIMSLEYSDKMRLCL